MREAEIGKGYKLCLKLMENYYQYKDLNKILTEFNHEIET